LANASRFGKKTAIKDIIIVSIVEIRIETVVDVSESNEIGKYCENNNALENEAIYILRGSCRQQLTKQPGVAFFGW